MPRTETTLITTGDFDQRLGLLLSRLDELPDEPEGEPSSTRRAGERSEVSEVKRQYQELRQEAEAAGVSVTQRGLGDDEWDELIEKFPPREGNDGDRALMMGDTSAARRALIYMSLVEPEFTSRAAFDAWVRDNSLTRGDLSLLAGKAWRLTNGVYQTPKSLEG